MASTKELVLKLCKKEGKKAQVNVAQMTEIVGQLADVLYCEYLCGESDTGTALIRLGYRRYFARQKKRRARK